MLGIPALGRLRQEDYEPGIHSATLSQKSNSKQKWGNSVVCQGMVLRHCDNQPVVGRHSTTHSGGVLEGLEELHSHRHAVDSDQSSTPVPTYHWP
jgi:hypothetical protein